MDKEFGELAQMFISSWSIYLIVCTRSLANNCYLVLPLLLPLSLAVLRVRVVEVFLGWGRTSGGCTLVGMSVEVYFEQLCLQVDAEA